MAQPGPHCRWHSGAGPDGSRQLPRGSARGAARLPNLRFRAANAGSCRHRGALALRLALGPQRSRRPPRRPFAAHPAGPARAPGGALGGRAGGAALHSGQPHPLGRHGHRRTGRAAGAAGHAQLRFLRHRAPAHGCRQSGALALEAGPEKQPARGAARAQHVSGHLPDAAGPGPAAGRAAHALPRRRLEQPSRAACPAGAGAAVSGGAGRRRAPRPGPDGLHRGRQPPHAFPAQHSGPRRVSLLRDAGRRRARAGRVGCAARRTMWTKTTATCPPTLWC